jgi:hypothetical protein
MVNAQHKARLTAWIRDRYYGVGLDKNDAFIGKKLFNKRLSPNSEGFSASEIEATVNELSSLLERLLPSLTFTAPQPLPNPDSVISSPKLGSGRSRREKQDIV